MTFTAVASHAAISVDVVTETPDLSPYREIWEELFERAGREPSASYEWTSALVRHHLEPGDRFLLMRMARDGRPFCFVPLVAAAVKLLGRKVVVLSPIAERYNTHSELLSTDLGVDVTSAFMASLRALDVRWDLFRMARVLERPALAADSLADLVLRDPAAHVREGDASYHLTLPRTFGEYLARRSGKFRNHLKRTVTRIDRLNHARTLGLADMGGVDAAYDALVHVERQSWKHTHGTAITAVARQVGFYRELCRGAAARGRLDLQFLMLGGEPVAYNLGYLWKDGYFYLKTSYAEHVKRLGAATYLRAALIESLIARGVRVLDFPAEPYEWERQWTREVRWHNVVSLHRGSLVGRALAWADRFRHPARARRVVEHVDPRRLRPASV